MNKVTDHLGNEFTSQQAMCDAYKISRTTYKRRLERGWTQEAALTTPSGNTVPGGSNAYVCNDASIAARKAKTQVRGKAYRESHKEEYIAYQKAYRESHKEEVAAKRKAYCEAHKEEKAAYRKTYYEAHKEELAARQKAYYEANKEEISRKQRERYAARKAAATA